MSQTNQSVITHLKITEFFAKSGTSWYWSIMARFIHTRLPAKIKGFLGILLPHYPGITQKQNSMLLINWDIQFGYVILQLCM